MGERYAEVLQELTRNAACARLRLVTVLLVAALTFAGCGGDDETSPESYADAICDAMTVWTTALTDADTRLSESSLSAAALEDMAADAKNATETLAEEIAQLEPPETDDADVAQMKVDGFAGPAGALREHAMVIEQALDADIGMAARAETVAVAVGSAIRVGRSLLDELRLLGPRGELADAFRDSSECESLSSQMPDVGS